MVDGSNKVSIRPVQLGDTSGSEWIVTSGSSPASGLSSKACKRFVQACR